MKVRAAWKLTSKAPVGDVLRPWDRTEHQGVWEGTAGCCKEPRVFFGLLFGLQASLLLKMSIRLCLEIVLYNERNQLLHSHVYLSKG